MINHARNLLVNIDGTPEFVFGYPGDEIIDPAYRAVILPSELVTIRKQLFGQKPDRYMLNYRAKQFLALLDSTQLQGYVTHLDPRITYDIHDKTFTDRDLYKPKFVKIRGVSERMTLISERLKKNNSGVLYHSYYVEVSNGDTVTTTLLQRNSKKFAYEFEIVNGIGSSVPLLGCTYDVRFDTDYDALWFVSVLDRPTFSLAEIVSGLEKIGEPNLVFLFGLKNEEPFLTFRNLWFQHKQLSYRLGGLLLAYIYRSEEYRRG